jgi:outer membrane protein
MRTLFVFVFSCLAFMAQAQTPQKIGSADFEYIFSQLPDSKQIEADMKTHSGQLENQAKAKYQEYTAKLEAYKAMPATTPDAIRKDKENELQGLSESIQKFQQDAQASLQKKNTELMDPVYKKVAKAIETVAKENGYTFIIGQAVVGSGDVLLYGDETYNISNLVLKKLGVTPTAATTAATPK